MSHIQQRDGSLRREIKDAAWQLDTELTATERRYLAEVYADLCRLDNMTRGVYAEALVAEALPGAARPSGWGAVDVLWDNISIQVKTSGARQYWHVANHAPSPAQWTISQKSIWDAATNTYSAPAWHCDVYVLARHEGTDHRSGWTFHVLSQAELVALLGARKSVTAARLESAGYVPVTAEELLLGRVHHGPVQPPLRGARRRCCRPTGCSAVAGPTVRRWGEAAEGSRYRHLAAPR
jgi:hypothetical protein